MEDPRLSDINYHIDDMETGVDNIANEPTDNDIVETDNMFWKANNYVQSIKQQYNRIGKVRNSNASDAIIGVTGSTSMIPDNTLGYKLNVYPRAIHEFYDEMYLQTQGILELGCSLVYDMYKNWARLKAAAPNEYESLVNKGKGTTRYNSNVSINDDNTLEGSECNHSFFEFASFLENITNVSGSADLNLILNTKSYILKVTEYRNTIRENGSKTNWNDDKLIELDIENSPTSIPTPCGDSYMWHNGIKYRVQPVLVKLVNNILGNGSDSVTPLVKYNILVDIDSVCRYIICKTRFSPEAIFDSEKSFINYFVNSFGAQTSDQLSKNVALTTLLNFNIVKNDWYKFITTFNDSYVKLTKKPDIDNMILKLRETNNGIPFDYNTLFSDPDHFNETCDKLRDALNDPSTFINYLKEIADMNGMYPENEDYINAMLFALFNRSFTNFYEFTYVLLEKNNILCATKSEFGEINLVSQLSEIINGIDDYDCKSFFTDCVLRFKDNFVIYDNKKQYTNAIAKLSHMKRNAWIRLTNEFNAYSRFMIKVSMMDQTPNTKKLSETISDSLGTVIRKILNYSSTDLNIFAHTHIYSSLSKEIENYRNIFNTINRGSMKSTIWESHDEAHYLDKFLTKGLNAIEPDKHNRTLIGSGALFVYGDIVNAITSFNIYDLWVYCLDRYDTDDWDDLKELPRFDSKKIKSEVLDNMYMRFGFNAIDGNKIGSDYN